MGRSIAARRGALIEACRVSRASQILRPEPLLRFVNIARASQITGNASTMCTRREEEGAGAGLLLYFLGFQFRTTIFEVHFLV